MNGNTIAKVLAYASLLALIMPAASAAVVPAKSGTYFYTGDYFDKAFGEPKPVVTVSPKSGCMMFTDSDAFHVEFGIVKSTEKLTIRQLPLGEEQFAPEASGTKPAENGTSPEIVVVPVAAEALANKTADGTGDSGLEVEIVAKPKGGEIATGEEEASTTEYETGLAVAEKPPEDETLTTGAAVSKGVPMQAAVIGVLIVIIVIMLVVLLVRKEPGSGKRAAKKAKPEKKSKIEKKDVWEEGSFFKEAIEKREAKRNGDSNEKREVKPFLLKIKDETS